MSQVVAFMPGQYTIRLRGSLQNPAPFASIHHALDWVRLRYPRAFFDLEYQTGRGPVLAIFWCPDGDAQIRIGSLGSLSLTP